jgi:hypothetical protein
MRISVKNWKDFQHYKDRSPPWIKLHKGLLDNFEYQRLPIASRALAPMLWLLASESDDGSIDADYAKLAFRLRTTEKDVEDGLKPLIENGFFVCDSGALAACEQSACLETEREAEAYKEEGEKSRGEPGQKSPRGSRLHPDLALTDEWMAEAHHIRPELNRQSIAAIFLEFKDHWIGKAGKDGLKADWTATWRNWVRRERGFNRAPTPYLSEKQRRDDATTRAIFGSLLPSMTNEKVIEHEPDYPATRLVG